MNKTTFYDKLTSVRHINLNGSESYSTHKGNGGEIICRPGKEDQRILIYADEETGRMSISNITAKIDKETFRFAGNTCAEEWYKEIELISK